MSFTLFGSQWDNRSVGLILGKWIPYLDLVCIGWILDDGGGGEELVFEDEETFLKLIKYVIYKTKKKSNEINPKKTDMFLVVCFKN